MAKAVLKSSKNVALVQTAEALGHNDLVLIESSRSGADALGFVGVSDPLDTSVYLDLATTEAYTLQLGTGTLQSFDLRSKIDPLYTDLELSSSYRQAPDFGTGLDFSDDLSVLAASAYVDVEPFASGSFVPTMVSLDGGADRIVSDTGYDGVSLSGDGTVMMSAGDTSVRVDTIGPDGLSGTSYDYRQIGQQLGNFGDFALSTDGRYFASVGYVIIDRDPWKQQETVKIFDTQEQAVSTTVVFAQSEPALFDELYTPSTVELEFSPTAQTLAVAANTELFLVDAATGARTDLDVLDQPTEETGVLDMAWSRDGKLLAFEDRGTVRIYDTTSAEQLADFDLEGVDGNRVSSLTGLSFSSENDTLYFSSEATNLVENDTAGSDIFSLDLSSVLDTSIVTTATRGSHLATAMIGAPRTDENGLKEASAVHLGNGVYLTDSRFRIEADGTGLDADLTFVHGQGTDIEQAAFTMASTTADRNALDLDRAGADEIAMIKTGVDAGHKIGMVIYADPSDAEGEFHINSYSRAEQGEVMHEYDVTLSAGADQDVVLKNRDVANDVWVTDGLPIEAANLGGTQGAGLFQQVDGVDYLAGIMVGPWKPKTDQAFVVDPVGENYAKMARHMLKVGEADDYGTNLIVASSDGGRLRGTGLNETLRGSAESDVLIGRDGDDRLIDGDGSDKLRDGSGADVFVLTNDGEKDRILDFNLAEDRIDLSDYGIDSLTDVNMRTIRDGLVKLTVGGDTVVIRDGDGVFDLTAADLTDDALLF